MPKRLIATIALFTFTPWLIAQTHVESPQKLDLNGNWTIHWIVNGQQTGTPNTIQLTQTDGVLSGTFKADSGESCSLNGTAANGSAAFRIHCTNFEIALNGQIKDQEIDGDYNTAGKSMGAFRMEKKLCWLPEGCGGQ